MPRKITPSSVVYSELKRFGLSNYEAAEMIMNTQLTFDGQPLMARIEESSQLSRRIVHTEPGEIPRGMFRSFSISVPQIARALLDECSIDACMGNCDAAASRLTQEVVSTSSDRMLSALEAYGIDGAIYRNMISYVIHSDLAEEKDRLTLALMMFIATGCLGNPRAASIITVDYATEILGGDFQTAQTVVSAAAQPEELQTEPLLGFVRLTDGKIRAGANMHVLNPEGTEIGMLPKAKHTIVDVGGGVSRRHAYVWRDGERWFVVDLGSTNGTRVVSGATGEVTDVPARGAEDLPPSDPQEGVEIAATDIVELGWSTRYIVVPALLG